MESLWEPHYLVPGNRHTWQNEGKSQYRFESHSYTKLSACTVVPTSLPHCDLSKYAAWRACLEEGWPRWIVSWNAWIRVRNWGIMIILERQRRNLMVVIKCSGRCHVQQIFLYFAGRPKVNMLMIHISAAIRWNLGTLVDWPSGRDIAKKYSRINSDMNSKALSNFGSW